MPRFSDSSSTCSTVCSGVMTTGSCTTPDSYRLTFDTSAACCSAVMFLWMTPIPPSCAMAMARRASVTVSMAADTSGRFRVMLRVKRVTREVSLGRTWEYAGTNNTSSKVSAFPRRRM